MEDNKDWKDFLEGLTELELFYMTTARHGNTEGRLAGDIAQRALSLPITDFEFESYVGLMGDLVDGGLRNGNNYRVRRFGLGNETELEAVAALGLDCAMGYMMQLQMAHKVTEGIEESKRLQLITGSGAWNNVCKSAQIHKALQIKDGNLEATFWDVEEQREKRFSEYDFILSREDVGILILNEGMPSETKEKIWDRSSEAMRRTGYSLGGGEGNQLIRVAYSLGQQLPTGLRKNLSVFDEELLNEVEAGGVLKQGDKLFMSPRDYALITLRQDTKGISFKVI